MLFTLLGIVTDAKDEQPSKAKLPMLFKQLDSVTDVKDEQPSYLLLIDYQYFAVKKVEKWIYGFYTHSERVRFNVFNFYSYENYVCMLSNPLVLK